MRIRNFKDLGAYLRTRRTQLGMDQATLAEKAGTSRKWLIEVENGKPGASLGLVLRTLRALDVSIDLSDDDPVRSPSKVLKPNTSKTAALEPAKRSRRRVPILKPGREDLAPFPAEDINEVLHALNKAATRR
jgi:HTH-type transcriptional regulator/antitoxin HipB